MIAAACSSDSGDTTTTAGDGGDTTTTSEAMGDGVPIGMAYDIGGRGDLSFNDSAAVGLDRAAADLGIVPTELEPSAGGENREENLRLLAEAGNELVFGIGFAFAEALGAAAADFPDTSFAIVDDASLADVPNVTSLVFAEEQGSALVGAAAALKTETGKIGFVGGVDIDLIKKFEAGYEFGAKQINPDIQIEVTYLTSVPDFSGFADPAKGKEAATAMYEGGADIVYHAAGGSGAGVFEAAKDYSEANGTHVWAIGVDSDQYNSVSDDLKPYILTSMLKRVDVAVYSTISSYVNDGQQSGVVLF
ncbi:MAG: BMP family ABC transporter substrate-binding protein, partial [Acidimicrobiia bacterium]|nr:BMP family ABC transporter substrate-binding protein [Acidimicrobiia bacterium]